jgi:signal transduction histidine kinase
VSGRDPSERLVAATRRRLALVTLAVLALLVVGVGAATAIAAIRALDQSVDRALETAVSAELSALEGELPTSGGDEGPERVPQASDTFFLALAPDGTVVANPSGIVLPGLPDLAAVASARSAGSDLRTVEAGDTRVRLLTRPITGGGTTAGWLQAGFILTLREEQVATIVATTIVVGLVGLLAAALATLYVTGRALVPIRAAFATERRFVADASHEIRTPAAIIRASAELLEREGHVADDGRPLVDDVIAEADRLGRLVEDLLALASAERGAVQLEREPIDLAAIARDTARRASPLAAERGISLVGPPDGGPPLPAIGDPSRLVQLLLVLVDNALGHAPAGGRVTIGAGPDEAGRSVLVTVDDQGPGVPAADRERVFEPFARLPGSRARADTGSGLGLAIARQLATLHDGTLTVAEAPGGGARFTLALPRR